jgi:hypothetical protein
MSEVDKASFDTDIAIGELGTQFFFYNTTKAKFEYALPLADGGGGEYGGDTETFDAPEMDLAYTPKISGRTSLNDIELTSNYTKDRYKRWLEILSNTKSNAYLEVYSDGSASVYSGTAGMPSITRGNPRTINATIAPENLIWVADINAVTEEEYAELKDMLGLEGDYTSGYSIPFDYDSIPNKRVQFFQGEQE